MRKARLVGGLALWARQGAAAAQTVAVGEEEHMDEASRKLGEAVLPMVTGARVHLLIAAAATLTLLVATALFSAGSQAVVRGQASYRERIALPPDAVFEATLEDVSRPGAKAEVLGTVRLDKAGPVPIRFEIPYDPGKVDARHSYAVRARILRGDRLLFTTDTVHAVLTRGAGAEVELLLVRSRAKGEPETPVSLENTHWTLVELGGKPVPAGLPQEPHLEFLAEPRRVAGSGGCNRLTGEYERDGDRLSFKPLASTRRACIAGGMDTEDAFVGALPSVRAFRIAGSRLELRDITGDAVAALEAAAPPPASKP